MVRKFRGEHFMFKAFVFKPVARLVAMINNWLKPSETSKAANAI